MDDEARRDVRQQALALGLDPEAAVAAVAARFAELQAATSDEAFDALYQAILATVPKAGRGAPAGPAAAGGPAAPPAPAAPDSGLIWPAPSRKIINPYGGKQYKGPGYQGVVKTDKNIGVDIDGKPGDTIVAPASGVVVELHTESQGPQGHYGYGNSVAIKDDQGRIHRLSHLATPPFQGSLAESGGEAVRLKVGDRVQAGEAVGLLGQTGNASGPHLDYELRLPDGQFTDPVQAHAASAGAPQVHDPRTEKQKKLDAATADWDAAQDRVDEINLFISSMPQKLVDNKATPAENLRYNNIRTELADARRALHAAQSQVNAWQRAVDKEAAGGTHPPKGATRLTVENGYLLQQVADGYGGWSVDPSFKAVPYTSPTTKAPTHFQGADGQEYVLSADGTSATLVAGQGQKPKTYDAVTDATTGSIWTYDKSTGQKGTQLFPGTPHTVTAGNRQFPIDPKTGLAQTGQGVDLLSQAERAAADLKAQAEAASARYEAGRGALIARLQPLVDSGAMTKEQAAKQVEDYDVLWEPVAQGIQRQQEQRQKELLKVQQGQLQTQQSAERRQIAALAAELGSNAHLGAVAERGGPAALPGAMPTITQELQQRLPGAPGENIGQRLLRQMGFVPDQQTGLLSGFTAPPVPPTPPVSAPGAGNTVTPALPAQPGVVVPAAAISPTVSSPPAATPAAPQPTLPTTVPSEDEAEDPWRRPLNPFRFIAPGGVAAA